MPQPIIWTLLRQPSTDTETLGVLIVPSAGLWATVEAPWVPAGGTGIDPGKPYRSCLPDAVYRLVWAFGPQHGPGIYLEADNIASVSNQRPKVPRWANRLHGGNRGKDAHGCVCPGLLHFGADDHDYFGGDRGVLESTDAVKAINAAYRATGAVVDGEGDESVEVLLYISTDYGARFCD
ncbi:MAG: DUF5675 family protein [Pseudomonadota bacterium]